MIISNFQKFMQNIVLTGFMATGKSAVGQLLAQTLGYRFLDTDALIEQQTGKNIYKIFQQDGEAKFRQLEGDILQELIGSEGLVIATGGGMIVGKDNYRRMQKLGPIICLEADPEVILERANKGENKRPLLAVPAPLEQIASLLAVRRTAYARADFCIDTSDKNVNEVVNTILEYVRPK